MKKIIFGILLPLIGTSLGSALVFFIKNNLNKKIEKIIIGFSIGVMLSSSIFSLLIPSIELSNNFFIPPCIGFILGFISLMLLNKIHFKKDMLTLSVTMHNIPEGMAVGVSFAAAITGTISYESALLLSLGIALQNIPEGSIISIPYNMKGKTKIKSFIYGVLSGIVEPIFSIITLLLLNYVVPLLPYLLSYASGAMIYVIFDELIIQIHSDGKSFFGHIGILFGFILMMILDISF